MACQYPSVILTGLPGSGKTTCGALLAERLGRAFLDTDQLIEAALQKKVSEIFDEMGEAVFRQLESTTLALLNGQGLEDGATAYARSLENRISDELSRAQALGGSVIAVGGGVPESDFNRAIMKSLGTVVYISSPLDEIAFRLEANADRPLFRTTTNSADVLEAVTDRLSVLLDRRSRFYETADIKIETAGLNPDEIVNRLQEALKTVSKN